MFTEVSFIVSKATVRVERASILHVASKCRLSRRLWPKSAAMTWSPEPVFRKKDQFSLPKFPTLRHQRLTWKLALTSFQG